MSIQIHHNDLPPSVQFTHSVAVDTETMGLRLHRDRLCVVQLCGLDGVCHLVHFPHSHYEQAVNLKAILENPNICKIFHFARFDMAILMKTFGVCPQTVFCTKIASRLVRTYSSNHGLKDLCKTLLGVDLNKNAQSSDWGGAELTEEQQRYAASDVLHLHALKEKLEQMLEREGRAPIAQSCFHFLPTRALLDIWAGEDFDIFPYTSVT